MRSARRGGSGGFVLPATLWVLAGLAVLAAWIDGVVASDIERAVMAGRSLESELERRSTEATLIYLLATGRMNHRGLVLEEEQRFSGSQAEDELLPEYGDGELRVRGEVYAGLGGARFSLQDEGGLASVNVPDSPLLAALLGRLGLAAAEVRQVLARIEDYIDTDGDLTVNGAEHYDYRQHGMPPPADWIMASPWELKRVLGVDALITPAQWRRLSPLLTVRPVFGYNFDTMRPELLAALLDLDERGLRRVLDEREQRPISRLGQVAMLSGRHLDVEDEDVRVLPSRFVRITVWHEDGGPRHVTGVELTPSGESAPWRKDYRYSEAITSHDDSTPPPEPPVEVATALFR